MKLGRPREWYWLEKNLRGSLLEIEPGPIVLASKSKNHCVTAARFTMHNIKTSTLLCAYVSIFNIPNIYRL